jgi:hypothetical protein
MARRPDYRLIVATRGQTVLGFAAVFAPPDEAFALLEYLAVDERFRGGGIGSGLFRAAVDALAGEGCAGPLLIEVEAPVGDDAAERALQERRRTFYRRLGCRRIAGLEYVLPLRAVSGLPPPMHLFAHVPAPDVPLSRVTLERALRVIYSRVYGEDADDLRIAVMMAPVGDPVVLE